MPDPSLDELRYESAYDAPYQLRSRYGREGENGTTTDITEFAHLRQSIIDILTTPRGSRVLAPEYGSDIHTLLDQPVNDVFIARLYQATVSALRRWEPRLRIERVVASAPEYGQIQMDLYGVVLLGGRAVTLHNLTLDFAKDKKIAAEGFIPSSNVIAAIADSGFASEEQYAQARLIKSWSPAFLILGGDNNYPSGQASTILRNTATYTDLILAGKVLAVVGNHEDAGNGDLTPHLDRFPYLPYKKRYYRKDLFNGLVNLLVINTGYTSSGAATLEPDGNTVDSVQHKWLVSQIASCTGKYVILAGHHPFVSQVTNGLGGGRVFPALSWITDLPKVKLFIHGHTHTAQHLENTATGLHLLDVSAGPYSRRAMSSSETLYGADADILMRWAYADPGDVGEVHAARLTATATHLTVDIFHVASGVIVHSFTIDPL